MKLSLVVLFQTLEELFQMHPLRLEEVVLERREKQREKESNAEREQSAERESSADQDVEEDNF